MSDIVEIKCNKEKIIQQNTEIRSNKRFSMHCITFKFVTFISMIKYLQ